MENDTFAGRLRLRGRSHDQDALRDNHAIFREQKWRQFDHEAENEDIAISRWQDLDTASRHEATTPPERYFIGIALRSTRAKLTKGNQTVFDGPMSAGTFYFGCPSKQFGAQFEAPADFLHLHVLASGLPLPIIGQPIRSDCRDDLLVIRDPFVEQTAKLLAKPLNAKDRRFIRSVGEILVMHIGRLELSWRKVNPLPRWRLRRVDEYINFNIDRGIRLSDLAGIAGLSKMHFAAQFRAATGSSPRAYLINLRVEHAKWLLSNGAISLAEVALAAGFSNQSHFSTTFKRITGETPAKWRSTNEEDRMLAQGT